MCLYIHKRKMVAKFDDKCPFALLFYTYLLPVENSTAWDLAGSSSRRGCCHARAVAGGQFHWRIHHASNLGNSNVREVQEDCRSQKPLRYPGKRFVWVFDAPAQLIKAGKKRLPPVLDLLKLEPIFFHEMMLFYCKNNDEKKPRFLPGSSCSRNRKSPAFVLYRPVSFLITSQLRRPFWGY